MANKTKKKGTKPTYTQIAGVKLDRTKVTAELNRMRNQLHTLTTHISTLEQILWSRQAIIRAQRTVNHLKKRIKTSARKLRTH